MIIPCVHCGARNASEFRYLGEVGARPDPNATSPREWRTYLYGRTNKADWVTERWYHRAGCRRFLVAERHTVRNVVRAVRAPGVSGSQP